MKARGCHERVCILQSKLGEEEAVKRGVEYVELQVIGSLLVVLVPTYVCHMTPPMG